MDKKFIDVKTGDVIYLINGSSDHKNWIEEITVKDIIDMQEECKQLWFTNPHSPMPICVNPERTRSMLCTTTLEEAKEMLKEDINVHIKMYEDLAALYRLQLSEINNGNYTIKKWTEK